MEQQHIWDLIKTKQQTNIDIVTQIIKANPTIMSGDREFYTIMEWYENDLNRFLNVKGNEIRMERGYYTDALYIKRFIDERA